MNRRKKRLQKQRIAVLKVMIYTVVVLAVLDLAAILLLVADTSDTVEVSATNIATTTAVETTLCADVVEAAVEVISNDKEVPLASDFKEITILQDAEEECLTIDISEEEIKLLARCIYGEAGVVESTTEKMAIGWAILNQVDSTAEDFIQWDTLSEVVLSTRDNIQGYWAVEGQDIPGCYYQMAEDVLSRWYAEKDGVSVYRELPVGYTYWMGSFDGRHNYICCEYHHGDRSWARDNSYQF